MSHQPTIESLAARVRELEAENKRLTLAAKAFQDLNVCYRIGKRPSEKLFTALEKANATLAAIESAVAAAKKESQATI